MPVIHDGDDMILTSNSKGAADKGKIYFDEAKTIYVDEITKAFTGLNGGQTGDVIGDVTGDVTGDLEGNSTGTHTGEVIGDVTGDLVGDSSGTHTGDVVGDVTGDLVGSYAGPAENYVADPAATTDALDVEARAMIVSVRNALIALNLMDASS